MNISNQDGNSWAILNCLPRLYNSAWGAWSEYFVLRTSALTLPKDSDLLIPFLIDVVEDTKEKIQKEISDYRLHGDMVQFFPEFEERVYFLIKMAATVIGNIHGVKGLQDEMYSRLKDELFKESYFNDTWKNIWDALSEIYNTYPNWSGLANFDPVSNVVKATWNMFGIYPEMTEEGLYIHIP